MKMKNWLEFNDFVEVIGFHLLVLLFIYLIHNTLAQLILYEIANIGFSSLLLITKNYIEELRIKRQAKKIERIEEYRKKIKKENQN